MNCVMISKEPWMTIWQVALLVVLSQPSLTAVPLMYESPPEIHSAIAMLAQRAGMSINAFIRQVLAKEAELAY